jgi:hypothetical protein
MTAVILTEMLLAVFCLCLGAGLTESSSITYQASYEFHEYCAKYVRIFLITLFCPEWL